MFEAYDIGYLPSDETCNQDSIRWALQAAEEFYKQQHEALEEECTSLIEENHKLRSTLEDIQDHTNIMLTMFEESDLSIRLPDADSCLMVIKLKVDRVLEGE